MGQINNPESAVIERIEQLERELRHLATQQKSAQASNEQSILRIQIGHLERQIERLQALLPAITNLPRDEQSPDET